MTSPGPDAARPPSDAGPDQVLTAVLELELEHVMQSVLAARQDVLELAPDAWDAEVHRSADVTLRGCLLTIGLLLELLRRRGTQHQGIAGRLTGPFSILTPTGDVLYMNAAVTTLIDRDLRELTRTPFDERPWVDRDRMRAHLATAWADGEAIETFDVTFQDGSTRPLELRTERLSAFGLDALLMTLPS